MKRILYMLAILACLGLGYARADFFPTNTINQTNNVQALKPDWNDFTWTWRGWDDQLIKMSFLNGTNTVLPITNYYMTFQVTKGTSVFILRDSVSTDPAVDITLLTNSGTFTVPHTNIPPNGIYKGEAMLYNPSNTNQTRSVARGQIQVLESTYANTNLLTYPWPNIVTYYVTNYTETDPIWGAASNGVTTLASNSSLRITVIEGNTNGWNAAITQGVAGVGIVLGETNGVLAITGLGMASNVNYATNAGYADVAGYASGVVVGVTNGIMSASSNSFYSLGSTVAAATSATAAVTAQYATVANIASNLTGAGTNALMAAVSNLTVKFYAATNADYAAQAGTAVVALAVAGGWLTNGQNNVLLGTNFNASEKILRDSLGTNSIDWENRTLISSLGIAVLDYSALQLLDADGNLTVSWSPRQLISSVGNSVNWETHVLAGAAWTMASNANAATALVNYRSMTQYVAAVSNNINLTGHTISNGSFVGNANGLTNFPVGLTNNFVSKTGDQMFGGLDMSGNRISNAYFVASGQSTSWFAFIRVTDTATVNWLQVPHHAAIGWDGSIDGGGLSSVLYMFENRQDFTNPVYGIYNHVGLDGSTNNQQVSIGLQSEIETVTDVNYTGIIYAIEAAVTHSSTGLLGDVVSNLYVIGVNSLLENLAGGTMPSMGFRSEILNTNGIMPYAAGFHSTLENAGTIDNSLGVHVTTPDNTGTISNRVGLLIDDQSGIGTVASYNIESDGAGSVNWFEGIINAGRYDGTNGIALAATNNPANGQAVFASVAGGVTNLYFGAAGAGGGADSGSTNYFRNAVNLTNTVNMAIVTQAQWAAYAAQAGTAAVATLANNATQLGGVAAAGYVLTNHPGNVSITGKLFNIFQIEMQSSTGTGFRATALGDSSTALGNSTFAAGYRAYQDGNFGAIALGHTVSNHGGYGSGAYGYQTRVSADGLYGAETHGSRTHASNWHTFAAGNGTVAGGIGAESHGITAYSTNDYAWTWSGSAAYGSHGDGTFNLDPIGGLAGFWVGETNLGNYGTWPTFVTNNNLDGNTISNGTVSANLAGSTNYPIFGDGASISQTSTGTVITVAAGGISFATNNDMGGTYLTNGVYFGNGGGLTNNQAHHDIVEGVDRSTSLGLDAAAHTNSVAVGQLSIADAYGVAVGKQANAGTWGNAVGKEATGRGYGNAVGGLSSATNYGAVIGHQGNADNYGVGLGAQATGSLYGVAAGYRAVGGGTGNVAIGYNAQIPQGWSNTTQIGTGTATSNGWFHFRTNAVIDGAGNVQANSLIATNAIFVRNPTNYMYYTATSRVDVIGTNIVELIP